jgi:hypothetical protein
MDRLKTTPAANRDCNKAHIKHQVKCNKFNLIEQCEAGSVMTDDNRANWPGEVCHG